MECDEDNIVAVLKKQVQDSSSAGTAATTVVVASRAARGGSWTLNFAPQRSTQLEAYAPPGGERVSRISGGVFNSLLLAVGCTEAEIKQINSEHTSKLMRIRTFVIVATKSRLWRGPARG